MGNVKRTKKMREQAKNFLRMLVAYKKHRKTGDAEAWLFFKDMMSMKQRNICMRLFNFYGAQELDHSGVTEEVMYQEMDTELARALRNFDYAVALEHCDGDLCGVMLHFRSYAGIYMDGGAKRLVETANGRSRSYTWYLVHLKNAGLDLFKSGEDAIIESLRECVPKLQDGHGLVVKLRNYFENTHKTNLEHERELRETGTTRCIEDVESQIRINETISRLSKNAWTVFQERFSNGLSRRQIKVKTGLNYAQINAALEQIRRVFADEYADELRGWNDSYTTHVVMEETIRDESGELGRAVAVSAGEE